MRRLVYDVAVSADGFIAGPDSDISGFVPEGAHVEAYLQRLQDYDTVLMGRRTYEFGYGYGMRPGSRAYPHMAHHIFSRSLDLPAGSEVEVVRGDWLDTVDRLKASEGSDIYLCGGGVLAGFLHAHGRLDRLLLKLNPVVLGRGVPLFEGVTEARPLRLEGVTPYATGVVLLDYAVG